MRIVSVGSCPRCLVHSCSVSPSRNATQLSVSQAGVARGRSGSRRMLRGEAKQDRRRFGGLGDRAGQDVAADGDADAADDVSQDAVGTLHTKQNRGSWPPPAPGILQPARSCSSGRIGTSSTIGASYGSRAVMCSPLSHCFPLRRSLMRPLGVGLSAPMKLLAARVADVAKVGIARIGRPTLELGHAGAVGADAARRAGAAAAGVPPLLLADGAEALAEAALQTVAQDVPARPAR